MLEVSTKLRQQDVDGVWAVYQEGVRFLIARAGNPKYLRASDKAEAPYRKQLRTGKLSTEKHLEIQCRGMAEGMLLGWEGVGTKEGPLEYTVENAYAVLRHNSDVRDFVIEFATEQENYRTEEIAATAKK